MSRDECHLLCSSPLLMEQRERWRWPSVESIEVYSAAGSYPLFWSDLNLLFNKTDPLSWWNHEKKIRTILIPTVSYTCVQAIDVKAWGGVYFFFFFKMNEFMLFGFMDDGAEAQIPSYLFKVITLWTKGKGIKDRVSHCYLFWEPLLSIASHHFFFF